MSGARPVTARLRQAWRALPGHARLPVLALCGLLAAACAPQDDTGGGAGPLADSTRYRWKLVTTWPPNFPGLGTAANRFAEAVTEMSGGRLQVRVYGAGELVDAFEVFDAVSRGTAEMGHGGAYYWKGRIPASPLLSAVPFGFTAQEMNAWLYYGGGLELWRELYEPYGVVPFPAGNTGAQMGGWFNTEINGVADLQRLKIRMPGLGGEVMSRAGATVVNLSGGEIFLALQSGTIDATEWVGPYNDLAFGLQQAAKYYYAPGWHEPGPALELIVNREAWLALPEDLQAIVEQAAKATNLDMLAEFTARNPAALETLLDEHGIELRRFPEPVLAHLRELSAEVVAELVARDPAAARIHESIRAVHEQVKPWHEISERAILETRELAAP